MHKSSIAGVILGVMLLAADATAQRGDPGGRKPAARSKDTGWVSFDYGSQAAPSPDTVTSASTSQVFLEPSTLTAVYPFTSFPQLSIGGGVRLAGNFGVGVNWTYATQSDTASLSQKIPHPFFFNQLRSVAGTKDGLNRKETGIHILLAWLIPAGSHVQVTVEGGPSFYQVSQDLVTALVLQDDYPHDSVTLKDATIVSQSKNATGFNAGLDIAYMVQRNVGVGASIRFTRAEMDFDVANG